MTPAENLFAYAKCDTDSSKCGKRLISLSEDRTATTISTDTLNADDICIYTIYNWPIYGKTDFLTQIWYGYKIKVIEGDSSDFLSGVTSNFNLYTDYYAVSGDLEFITLLEKGKKVFVQNFRRGLGEHF